MTNLIGRLSDERKRTYIEVLGFAVFFVTVLIVAGYISCGLFGHGHRIAPPLRSVVETVANDHEQSISTQRAGYRSEP